MSIVRTKLFMVEATGLEPAASWSQTKHSTKLSYASIQVFDWMRRSLYTDFKDLSTEYALRNRCALRAGIRLWYTTLCSGLRKM